MRSLLTILFLFAAFSAFSQTTSNYDYLQAYRRFTLAGRSVKGISNDTMMLVASADSLVTQYALKGYLFNNYGPGTPNSYNFNPEHFIVSGYDVSIRFPQDPGEPLFTNSPSFNFTQQHLSFLDSLMLAVGEDTYLDDRDFYYSPDTLNPIRWKAFTLTTDGTGAASWDSVNKRLNIPVSSGGGGGSTDTTSLSKRIDSKLNISDTTNKWIPVGTVIPKKFILTTEGQDGPSTYNNDTLNIPNYFFATNDSIDYSFSSMTTIYSEYGPGDYRVATHGVTANPDNLNFPFKQLKAVDIGGWNAGDYVSFTSPTVANSTAYPFIRVFIRLKQAVPIAQSLSFQFYNNGVAVSNIISMVSYGLDKSKINSYQVVTIPMTAFGFTQTNAFDEVRLIFGGGSSPDGLYLDLFQFQNATTDQNKYITDVFRSPGTLDVYGTIGGQNKFLHTDSIGTPVDTQYLRRDINLKLNIADTSYLHAQLTQQLAAIQNNTANILLKLNISDTAAMLSPYANKIAANTLAIAGKEALITAGTTSQYWRGDKTWQTLNTTAVAEGTNLYYTDTRARAALTLTTTGTSGAATYNSTTGVINVPQYAASVGTITWLGTAYNINSGNNITLTTPTTSDISEGSNLYYTNARARAAISVTGSGTYDNTTGVINITGGSSSGWALGGNILTNSGAQYIGTNNNTSFRVRTNLVERLQIDSLGVVAIGTTTATSTQTGTKLYVAGAIQAFVAGGVAYWLGTGQAIRGVSGATDIYIDGNTSLTGNINFRATQAIMPNRVKMGGMSKATRNALSTTGLVGTIVYVNDAGANYLSIYDGTQWNKLSMVADP